MVSLLARTPVPPNILIVTGLLDSMGAAVLIVTGHPFATGFVVLIAGFFDIMDGALACRTGRVTRFGRIFDSTLDRLAEAAVLVGILVLYGKQASVIGITVVGVAWAILHRGNTQNPSVVALTPHLVLHLASAFYTSPSFNFHSKYYLHIPSPPF